ncbi:esterase/lipase family protein [Rhodococcus sp. NPDC058514]|uniref:esterase/lipase family protein n=1 Tax=unclassified Rhodococcus (in: high G+C Gram-positive bacteria) TaxID=192944 RepID=UPI0036551565
MRTALTAFLAALVAGSVITAASGTAWAAPVPSGTVPGTNDWSCRPNPEHPRPVVLVHGTGVGTQLTWGEFAPRLKDEGYCVYTLDYGQGGAAGGNLLHTFGGGDIAQSARELSGFVDRVLGATGAGQVDLVGYSLGGLVARQYLRFEGGTFPADPRRNVVRTVTMLGTPNRGITFGGAQDFVSLAERIGIPAGPLMNAVIGPSVGQQFVGSTFLRDLNAGGDTDPGVDYTVIASRYDSLSTPGDATFLRAGPGARVTNVWLQDGCATNRAGHNQLTTDPRSTYLIQTALDPSYSVGRAAPCD